MIAHVEFEKIAVQEKMFRPYSISSYIEPCKLYEKWYHAHLTNVIVTSGIWFPTTVWFRVTSRTAVEKKIDLISLLSNKTGLYISYPCKRRQEFASATWQCSNEGIAFASASASLHFAYWQLCPHQTQLKVVCKQVGQLEIEEQSEVKFDEVPNGQADVEKSTGETVSRNDSKVIKELLVQYNI